MNTPNLWRTKSFRYRLAYPKCPTCKQDYSPAKARCPYCVKSKANQSSHGSVQHSYQVHSYAYG